MTRKLFVAAFLSASAALAQTAQTASFRAVMQASSPAADSGTANILLHVVRDPGGNILSGSVDFSLAYQFPNDETVTGLGIAAAPAGQSGVFSIALGISAASPIQATAGSGRISGQAQVTPADQAGLAALTGLLANPSQYSVNLLTSDNPTGAMSGALQAAKSSVLMAVLSSSNASGVATVTVLYTGASYALTSAEVAIQASYQFPSQVTFSAMRIYAGQGEAGQLAVPAEIMPGTPSAASGIGVLTAPATEIDMSDLQTVEAVQNILRGPTNFSLDIDTVENPTSPLIGQLRVTDLMTFPIPAIAGAASAITLRTLRQSSGAVAAGTVIFDVNYRLAAGVGITNLDIDGSILAPAVTTDPSGSGNVYALVSVGPGAGLTSLSNMVSDPETGQLEIQTTSSATAISAPLATVDAAPPVVAAVIPIVEDKTLATFAPGELVEIYGTNLAKVTTDLSAWPGGSLPSSLNGVTVTLGGQTARLLFVSPLQADALFAFETPTGDQSLTVDNGNGPSAPLSVNVAPIAPALYSFVFKNADFSRVSSSNPAKAGDVLVFYATGLGQTTPPLTTGQTVPLGPPYFYTAAPTMMIGGLSLEPIYSIASPPYVTGLYQIAVTMPSGLGSGSVPVSASAGGVQSNTITISAQ